jgi:pimeloyl-ACP methyl ester carboxylesterase
MDNWDPAVTDALAAGREVILFDSAGIGRSSGSTPNTVAGMAAHALAFLDALKIENCDVLGFSLGGMVAQQMALDRPSIFRRMILVGTAPRGGEDIMHLDKPSLAQPLSDATLKATRCFRRSFSRLRAQARRKAPLSQKGSWNAARIVSPFRGRRSPRRKWARSGNGSSFQASVSPP